MSLKRTPLYDRHAALGAKMVPFAGWEMPLEYVGILEEHIHTRTKVSLFDICHMGEFVLKGPSIEKEIEGIVTCNIGDMPPGKCRYGFMLNENGGIIDDLIVFKISPEKFMLVVNAATCDKDKKWLKKCLSKNAEFVDISENTAKLDIQGPLAGEALKPLLKNDILNSIRKYSFSKVDINGIEILLSRTGYTGELGYELFFPAANAAEMWDVLLKVKDVEPAGLGARDTLRMEMGYSLYGNDIDEEHTPFEANLDRFVFMDKDFIGKEALLKQRRDGLKRVLTGFICETRRSARRHFDAAADGKIIGQVTSGTFSPCLKKGIGLCYVDKEFIAKDRTVTLKYDKIEIEARLKNIPLFVKPF